MKNRFFVLLTLCCVVFGGCPSPESEERNQAFEGTLLFTADGVINRMDLKTGVITALSEGSGPLMTPLQTIIAAHVTGLVELSDNGNTRQVIVPKDQSNASTHDDGFLDPQLRSGRIAYHFAGRSYVVDATSGALLHEIANAVRPVWLDDSNLLLRRGAELHRYSVTTGESAKLASSNGRDHVLSPDGSRIVFVEGKDLFIMNVDGSDLKPIMSGHTELRYPVWSKDGTHIIVMDACDLKLFKVSGGMVQSFKSRYFTFKDEHCPDASQTSWH